MAADGGFTLDQRHFLSGVGERQRGVYAGYAAAHHQHIGVHRHALLVQRLVVAHAGYGRADQVLGFFGGGFFVRVHPGGVLADIYHLEIERVKAALGRGLAESLLVQERRAGRHYQALQLVLSYVLGYHLLAGVGAHVFIIARNRHSGQAGRVFLHFGRVYYAGDIGAAVADIEADAGQILLLWFILCHSYLPASAASAEIIPRLIPNSLALRPIASPITWVK